MYSYRPRLSKIGVLDVGRFAPNFQGVCAKASSKSVLNLVTIGQMVRPTESLKISVILRWELDRNLFCENARSTDANVYPVDIRANVHPVDIHVNVPPVDIHANVQHPISIQLQTGLYISI